MPYAVLTKSKMLKKSIPRHQHLLNFTTATTITDITTAKIYCAFIMCQPLSLLYRDYIT